MKHSDFTPSPQPFELDLDDLLHPAPAFAHPRDVVADGDLTVNEKGPFLPPQDSFVLSGFRVGGSAMKPKGVVDLFIEPGTGRNRLALLRRYKDPFTVTS